MRTDCQHLINGYIDWLKQGFVLGEGGDHCEITTPFLDRHNDAIQIYLEEKNGGFVLSDDGYTISDLRSTGFEFTTPKRKALLTSILNGFGVKHEGGELLTTATRGDFAQKKHNLVQAILAVNDLFALSEQHILSFFKEDVRTFLELREIQKFQDFKLAGKSGFDHKFDFALPKTRNKPERVLEAVNLLSKDQAISLAWAVSDVKAIREEPLDVLVFINDIVNPPTPDNVSALQAYDIKTLLWSQRERALPLLNGSDTVTGEQQRSLPT
jgi:hypothetical protein